MESPFYTGSELDYAEIIEFLLRRYHSLEVFYPLSIREFAQFWKVAQEQEKTERNYTAWVAQLPYMDKEHFTSFKDYNEKCLGNNIDRRSASEIQREVEEIRRKVRENGNITI